MRKIECRIWDKYNKKWLGDDYWSGKCVIDLNGDVFFFSEGAEDLFDRSDDTLVTEFTSLTDVNGRKIFEGDIVEKEGLRGTVNFQNGAFGVDGSFGNILLLWANTPIKVKVVGNIFETAKE